MKFYHAIYCDEKTIDKKEEIQKKLCDKKNLVKVYLVTLSNMKQNQLEIFDSMFLLQKRLQQTEYFVVGITSTKSHALEMVEKITQEVYDETMSTDIKGYIMRKQEEYEKEKV
jgi:hypothetical protein